MIEGVIWAVIAGLMLGLYALPEKFTKGFEFENTWSLFFAINTFVVPNIAAFLLIDGFADVLAAIPSTVLVGMVVSSILWGIGAMMWGKAINYIGLSLGFSIFIGTIILVGSLIPFFVGDLPETNVFLTILGGLFIVLIGVISNAKAGITRQKDEAKDDSVSKKGSVVAGILIAVIGGLLATGFSFANSFGASVIDEASQAQGNPAWVSAIAVMYVIYMAGGVAIAIYFIQQLTAKKLWGKFKSPHLGKNILLTSIMGVFNFAASSAFAYAAFKLGKELGGSVGYAIFNTACVVTAIVSGIITKEWVNASSKAKNFLYISLACMIGGILVIAYSNSLG
ncbi:L-rhamnose/proton symporter RhaT [Wenyingzhuangia sp. 2_MG-2023]|uniref:L-rhamnose/proton symporter RhaT n=1 Tax=Wenyingzhuangia sp. 2_MG-2023 TaxID=3062639 RepID=UPI0026E266F9|nr:L-rhamnose/proton symporter RhaT [Wenyingzhuangia sp. 2_MG-2023]MDO6736257.1 L-rhamnose/proton symporter RhaT [Wenyingzhuangia sp. 2_MG-2023]MDO6801440.1 L-rhamnose/proton symporter RhaT [Wenyingzhuangia sp. 1_MG-2023]